MTVQSICTLQTQFLHIIPNHFQPGLPCLPLGLAPITSIYMHFFAQSLFQLSAIISFQTVPMLTILASSLTCLSLIKSTLYPNLVIFISETSVEFVIFLFLQPQLLQIHLSLTQLAFTTSLFLHISCFATQNTFLFLLSTNFCFTAQFALFSSLFKFTSLPYK